MRAEYIVPEGTVRPKSSTRGESARDAIFHSLENDLDPRGDEEFRCE